MNGSSARDSLTTVPETAPALPTRDATANAARVSVIVRSMDRPTLIEATRSVALQDHPSIEVVLVNARGAAHTALPHSCGRFPIVAVESLDGGPLRRAQAANKGLDAATGSLVIFLDDDDLLLPNHISRLAGALHANDLAPAAFADVEMGRSHGGSWMALHRFDAGFDATRLFFENYLPIHGVLFRRPAPSSGLRFDEQFELFEDWDFWLQMASVGPFVHVPGVTARYRVSELEQSNVFADSPATQAARQRLFEKWQSRISPAQHCALLARLQTLFREAPQLRAQASLTQVTSSNLQDIVHAREVELSQAAQMLSSTEHVLLERERELAESQVQYGQLQAMLAERERELKDAHVHASGLEQILAAREHDAKASAAHAAALANHLSERERELANAQAHAAGIQAIVEAREREAANAVAHATGLEKILTERDREVADALMQIAGLRKRLGLALAPGTSGDVPGRTEKQVQKPGDTAAQPQISPAQKEAP